MKALWVGSIAAALALGLWASCGGDDSNGGDGGDTGDSGPSCTRTDECHQGHLCVSGHCSRVLPTLEETGADMSCRGNNPPVDPLPGTVTATLYVEDFEDDYAVEGATIDLFLDGIVDDSPDQTVGPANASGEITGVAGLPARGLIAYRVHGEELPDGVVRITIEYDVETPETDGGRVRILSVSDNTYLLIQTILGITPDSSHGVIAGEFDDCASPAVPSEGIVVRLLNAGGQDCHELNQRECYYRYFQDSFPARIDNQTYSSADGLYAAAQVPPGEWKLEVRGRLTDASPAFPFDLLGEKTVRATADAIVIVDVNVLAALP